MSRLVLLLIPAAFARPAQDALSAELRKGVVRAGEHSARHQPSHTLGHPLPPTEVGRPTIGQNPVGMIRRLRQAIEIGGESPRLRARHPLGGAGSGISMVSSAS
jgi:hypothetical protein